MERNSRSGLDDRWLLVSFITVTYNAEHTISRTLESVAAQVMADRGVFEHIIIDGASKDGTLDIVNEYRQRVNYPVTVVSKPDKGLYDAMNKGIDLAKGEYMVFLNAGDKLHSNKVIRKLWMELHPDRIPELPGVVYGDTHIVDDEGRFLRTRKLRPPKKLTWKSFKQGMLVCHQSFYVHRSIVQKYDLQYRFSADFDWCIRCMKEGKRRNMNNVAIMDSSTQYGQSSFYTVTDYLSEGMTTANHKASLKERFNIMCKHYGTLSTILHHLWFLIR